ncbi:MAG: molybdate ABC transporter substrate-binding protein [Tuberibacillus sp.]
MRRIIIIMILMALSLSGCQSHVNKEKGITVSAAASLADALNDISAQFTDHTGIPVHLNLASSGSLEKQIEQGAPADLFLSASENDIDPLVKKGLIDQNEVQPILTNQLVLITPKGSHQVKTVSDLAGANRIAIGTPELVPAGQYAKEALTSLNLWPTIQSKMVYGKDVRQVLNYVETGNVDAGLVYKSDALISSKVKVIQTLPASSHQLIIYPCALIKDSRQSKAAQKFYRYLQSKEAEKTFIKYGFEPMKKELSK